MRIGEGGTGTVYKALMHGVDEVAVKVVRTAQPTLQEAASFHRVCLVAGRTIMCCCCSLDMCRTACTGTVYKALMRGVDEVAVKGVRTALPTLQEAASFHRVRSCHISSFEP